jgi:hypothetical protein
MIFNFIKHPKKKYVYAITRGVYLGELFVYMETKEKTYYFLSLPEMKIREVPIKKFEFGLTERIIDIADKMPLNVYDVCRAQYNKNTSLN